MLRSIQYPQVLAAFTAQADLNPVSPVQDTCQLRQPAHLMGITAQLDSRRITSSINKMTVKEQTPRRGQTVVCRTTHQDCVWTDVATAVCRTTNQNCVWTDGATAYVAPLTKTVSGLMEWQLYVAPLTKTVSGLMERQFYTAPLTKTVSGLMEHEHTTYGSVLTWNSKKYHTIQMRTVQTKLYL
jgi:hypothetical protein